MATIYGFLTFVMVSILLICFFIFLIGWRWIMKYMTKQMGKTLLTDNYEENLLELIPSLKHMGVLNVWENSLRAEKGNLLLRPLGSIKKWPHFDEITFIPAQITPFPIDGEEEVDIAVTIGPRATKPMKIPIPLMISGMAYGVGVSENIRLALAKAAKKTGTAINSGEGGILPEELEVAGKYILQFSKTEWSKEDHLIKRADMIEIKLGQGAIGGMGEVIPPEKLTGRAREVMGLKDNEDAIIYEHFYEEQTFEDIKDLVTSLRKMTGGVPIGVKIGAGGKIEKDIDHLIELDVDFISIDGGQAATHGAPPILADDFGIPTLHGLVRAVNHLKKRRKKEDISIIISGGLFTPGHFLKVLALGADAVYLGSAILYTVTHNQVFKAIPFEPPTQVVWNEGEFKDRFNVEEGAKTGEKFIWSCVEEMKTGLRAMGKQSLQEFSKNDLVSYDPLTAKMIGIPYSFEPWEEK